MRLKISGMFIAACVGLLVAACNKNREFVAKQQPPVQEERIVKFTLSADADFSDYRDSIFFTMRVEKIRPLIVMWESHLPPMELREIPVAANPFEYTKKIAATDTGVLRIGFRYTIKGVGQFWKYDSLGRNEKTKTVHLGFR